MANNINTCYIADDMIIKGDIITPDDIIVEGRVEGLINAGKTLEVRAGHVGGATATNIKVASCDINGDLVSQSSVIIDEGSRITGNVSGSDVKIMGSINGNVNVENKIELYSSSSIKGDIEASNIAIEEGAVIQGRLNIVRR